MTGWAADADRIVVGSGVAGLTAALDAVQACLRVVVVTKDAVDAGATRWAQGGVAVVIGDVPGDSVEAHVAEVTLALRLVDRDVIGVREPVERQIERVRFALTRR